MVCYHPIKGYRGPGGKVQFTARGALCHAEVPCGQCIGCRLRRSREWAIRCVHESTLYDRNCFLTLTYAPEFLPADGSLQKRHMQLFWKRLRKRFGRVRYYMCGEYGSQLNRPHYHACVFGFDFDDKRLWSVRGGNRLYRSAALEELWPYGFCTVGDVTFDSAAYVARYIAKKVFGDQAPEHYQGRLPEYTDMSRRPGIGFDWFQKFSGDVFPSDFLVLSGTKVKIKPPKYYETIFDVDNPEIMDYVKRERRRRARAQRFENSAERLAVREECQIARLGQLKRNIE